MTIYLPGTAPPRCGGSAEAHLNLDFSIRSWASPISQLMNHRNHNEIAILLGYSPCSNATTSLLLMFPLYFIPHCQLKITLTSHQNPRRNLLTSPQICFVFPVFSRLHLHPIKTCDSATVSSPWIALRAQFFLGFVWFCLKIRCAYSQMCHLSGQMVIHQWMEWGTLLSVRPICWCKNKK